MYDDLSPTSRALLLLELIQNSPGIGASRLAERLGVSERAIGRYVGIVREAGVPIESTRGPYGGYRVGRGARVPPLMFTTTEALALVMAALDGHHNAADPADPVGSALGKIMRVLPASVADPVDAVRRIAAGRGQDPPTPEPETTAKLVQACSSTSPLRLAYRLNSGTERPMDVDPWAVVVRHGRWYLLCWSHAKDARRALRIDRIRTVETLDGTFTPPADLNPKQALEEQLSEGWKYQVEVVIEAPFDEVAPCLPRALGRLDAITPTTTRLIGSTENPGWYVEQLTAVRAPFQILKSPELQAAAEEIGRRLLRSVQPPE
ncbi:WYL domain-containing protein [Kribbella qitaiheensis]|uniref:WYL domain-containing protein n=1 Tax=Kribbella qitaiheensis TaxID=1544730 RepID=A0A7G6WZ33_9ACTN|nr:WYL domain-containing protein [Kribbella qitaiheensis]QNE19248.1 WYL domain-containing protein [Kribbella qitaiheensis]